MRNQKYLGIKPGGLDGKPYEKYWNPIMKPMQDHVQHALAHGIEASELGFPVTEANQLLEPGYLPLENGYTRLENGQIFVATLTKMPGVNGKMIDWWFGWHYLESQRYKLWHPRCHVANRAEKMIGDDPNLSDREKYLNNPNYVTEYIGNDLQDIVISFSDPSNYLDVTRFQETKISTVMCGTVRLQKFPINIATLIHQIREVDDGCEMRSRFWLGEIKIPAFSTQGFLNKIVGSRFVVNHAVSTEMGRNMVVHCAMEMNHLASFLPELYTDYHSST